MVLQTGNFYSDTVQLNTGNGHRSQEFQVVFPVPFAYIPTVTIGITRFDVIGSTNRYKLHKEKENSVKKKPSSTYLSFLS
jgi:hypothetical protein